MKIEHVAIWTKNLEKLKNFYVDFFEGKASTKYHNPAKGFQSYFITFASDARLELMYRPDIPKNTSDTVVKQHLGIIHLAFGVESMSEVDSKALALKRNGYNVLSGPRKTGDGYYEFEVLDPDNNRLEVTTLFIE